MEIIVPCAGLSTRFPNLRPKYLLTDYSGKLMVEGAVRHFIGDYNITIAILAQHDKEYNAKSKIDKAFGGLVNVVILDNPTSGPAETVKQTIEKANIKLDFPIFIKDCDSFFNAFIRPGNGIYVDTLERNPNMQHAAAKSYVISNDQNIIQSVVEKQIVSGSFCAGGYQFETAESFINAYNQLSDRSGEIFISNVIDYMINNGSVFFEREVTGFIDIGTSGDWFKFNDRPTYFCDIDGTICKNMSEYTDKYEPLENNVKFLKSELDRGCKIIFCTARPEEYRETTEYMLMDMGFFDCTLLMGIHHSKRILINDFATSNPYPTALAVNLKRDSDDLWDYV